MATEPHQPLVSPSVSPPRPSQEDTPPAAPRTSCERLGVAPQRVSSPASRNSRIRRCGLIFDVLPPKDSASSACASSHAAGRKSISICRLDLTQCVRAKGPERRESRTSIHTASVSHRASSPAAPGARPQRSPPALSDAGRGSTQDALHSPAHATSSTPGGHRDACPRSRTAT